MSLEDFVDEEQIGEERAQVDRRVQVVDQLRADRRLRQHQLQRRLRVAGIAVDDRDERAVGRRRLEAELLGESGEEVAEVVERRVAAREELARLAAGVVVLDLRRGPARRTRA